jgi:hypothetical protein
MLARVESQGVNGLEKLPKTAGCTSPSRLLAIYIVHCRVHPDTNGKTNIYPAGGLRLMSIAHVSDSNCMHTGPTRSGTTNSIRPRFPKTNKNPIKVTMFGASHIGNSSTTQFHYHSLAALLMFLAEYSRNDVVRSVRLVTDLPTNTCRS